MTGRSLVTLLFGAITAAVLATAGSPSARLAAQVASGAIDAKLYQDLRWRSVGPHRGGRVTAVAGHRAQPSTFYMGGTGGGVFKTTDYGQTWVPITDGQIETGSIGAIEVAESDPNIIYVGTGSDGIRSNVIIGRGMYKSTDAGKTWAFVGLRDTGQLGAVKVHPQDPNVVFAAALGSPFGANTDRGVYRSKDGGKTWQKVLFVSDRIGAISLAMNPSNPNEVYVAMWRGERKPWTIISGTQASEGAGIYKTTDGGDKWTKLTSGLPQGLIGKIDLDISRSNPKVVYALVEAPGSERGLYRTDDAGQTWRQTSGEFNLLRRPFYYTNVDVDPKNPDIVFVDNESSFKSTDGGKTFTTMRTPHGDNHGKWINPDNADIFIQCNDGGANVTLNGGRTWSTQLNQATAEFYMVDVDNQFPYRLYAPQQDNSTIIVPSVPPVSWGFDSSVQGWIQGPGCETGQIHPRPDGKIVYGVCKGEFGRYNVETGQEKQYWVYPQQRYGHNPKDMKFRFVRSSPIEVSPQDPKVVYHGSQFLHRTTDEGVTWETISPDLTANEPDKQVISGEPITRDITGEEVHSALYSIEASRLEAGVIWTGSSDGPVHVTRDNGKTWKKVTPQGLGPDGRVYNIEDSPHRKGSAYVAVLRYQLNDFQPYLYVTNDYGASWTRLTDGKNGIPADSPVRSIREDPEVEGLLFAGTEFGIYVSFDAGKRWHKLQQNLPATPITDIRVHRGDLVISTMGRSFWIMDDISPLRQIARGLRGAPSSSANGNGSGASQAASSSAVAQTSSSAGGRVFRPADNHLFQPREAYRMRYASSPGGPDEPEYPVPGARIDYYFPTAPAGEVTLEILDPAGKVIRAYSSEPARGAEGQGQGMRGGRFGASAPARLTKKAGHNRFLWDLRHPGPWDRSTPEGGPNGPLAVPGKYQARLTSGSWTQTRTFELKIDPRVTADGVTQADLQQQLDLSVKVRDGISDARRLADRVRQAREKTTDKEILARLQKVWDKVVTAGGPYPQQMLIDQISNVGRMIGQADQKVGKDAVLRYDDVMKELKALQAEVNKILGPPPSSPNGR